jgi:hypothetical protein
MGHGHFVVIAYGIVIDIATIYEHLDIDNIKIFFRRFTTT